MKKVTAVLLAALMLLSFAACERADTEGTGSTVTENDTITDKETNDMTDTETESPIVDEEPVYYENPGRAPLDPDTVDYSGADWEKTIVNANARANGVSGNFTDAARNGFLVKNETSSLLYDLTSDGNKQVAGLYNSHGVPYFENTDGAFIILPDGTELSSAQSLSYARMNSRRIGYYYYDFRFCGHDFVPVTGIEEESYDLIANTNKWTSHDITGLKKKNGLISYTLKSPIDPYIYSPVNFSTEKFNAVKITLKTEYATSGQIFIIAGGHKEFSAEQFTKFQCTSGQWTTVTILLSDIPDYTGDVTGFRIDCGVQKGEYVEIKEISAISRGKSSVPFALEHTFHTYSDKMHEVVRAVAREAYDGGGKLETRTFIPKENVRKLILKNEKGETESLEGFDFSTVEYAAFDINGAGIFGIIMPATDNNGYLNIRLEGDDYVIVRGIEINGRIRKTGDVVFGHRIYTSDSHQFNDFRKEAYIERNPLTDVFVAKQADDAKYEGYDALAGCYVFSVRSTEFVTAFYQLPDKHFAVNALFCGDGVVDRQIYLRTEECAKTRRGRLECAAMLDENGVMLPLPLEVGKNFDGENEEPLFFPEVGDGRAALGETYVPITIGKDENKRFTMLHLYQNWGNYPLKQLSFISFHIPYYHLSVGVTETTCITPYFVNGKDGWMLPDFRANSAPYWPDGVQHTSVGRQYFLQYKDADGNVSKTETQKSTIRSSGPIYADIMMEYLSDDGKIKATYRHAEMAQTDETRTFYNMRLEVLEDVSFKDLRSDFSILSFDGHFMTFSKVGYLDENNKCVIEDVGEAGTDRMIRLGSEYPYFDYFGGSVEDSVNYAVIVIGSDITLGGKKYDGAIIFRDKYDGILNTGSLTLDLGEYTLKKGDVIELDLILLPWGYSTSKNDDNVRGVREDSCIDPFRLTVIEGEPYEDRFIPSMRAKDNKAVFKISGGKSVAAVRIYGFDSYKTPKVTFKADGKETDIKLAGPNGYDGYEVCRDEDGTYSFAFNVDMDKASEYEITVTQ